MKAAPVKEIKKELKHKSPEELLAICNRLANFKKENKELITYLLFEADHEPSYISSVKETIDSLFSEINNKTGYFIKKGLRKVQSNIRKFSRYSGKKETEVELFIYFCTKMKEYQPSIKRDPRLEAIYLKQIEAIKKKLPALHEDLQYDFGEEIKELEDYVS